MSGDFFPPPKVLTSRSARFRVLPLWSWSLAAVETSDGVERFWGYGFDPISKIASKKAESESCERFVQAVWSKTGVSPFSGIHEDPPPVAAGFGAHLDHSESQDRAFYEWLERVSLQSIYDGCMGFAEVTIPNMGMLFSTGLRAAGCELKVYQSRSSPYFSFAIGYLMKRGRDYGVVFGSATAAVSEQANLKAIAEALRKLAFIKYWKKDQVNASPLIRAAHHWLSPFGGAAAKSFILKGLKCDVLNATTVPSQPLRNFMKSCSVGRHIVSCYYDPSIDLPVPYGFEIPLM